MSNTSESKSKPPSCPRCRRSDVSASRRRWYDVPAVVLRLRPLRCDRCGHRFYRLATGSPPSQARALTDRAGRIYSDNC